MELLDRDGVETLWAKIKAKLKTINDDISSNLTNNYVDKVDFLALQNKVNTQQTTINSLSTDISNLQEALQNANNSITALATKVNNLDTKYLRKDQDDSTAYTITAKSLYKS